MKSEHRMYILTELSGDAYVAERERLLSDQPALSALTRDHLQSPDWRVRLQSQILEGWATNATLFRDFYAELNNINVQQEQLKMGGMARVLNLFEERGEVVYKQQGLPIWWEILLKFEGSWPDWKVVAAIRCLEGVPDPRSLEPLIWLMKRTESEDILYAVARALINVPPKERTRQELNKLIKLFDRKSDFIRESLEDMDQGK